MNTGEESPARIRVLIVDDQAMVREGLRVILSAAETIQVVGVAGDGVEAVERAAALRPDLILMDLKMPRRNGVEATRAIKAAHPEIAILVLTTYDDEEWVFDAIRAGASGYLLKDTDRERLIAAIEGTSAGQTHLDPAVAGKVLAFVRAPAERISTQTAKIPDLTGREGAILRLLASGASNAMIADRLSLAEGTVRNHITVIFEKLHVTDRAQATAFAWQHGMMRDSGDE